MTRDRAQKLLEAAQASRGQSQLAEAGDQYTRAACEYLGDAEWELPPALSHGNIAFGLYALLCAGTCFRIAKLDTRCQNRVKQGILIAQDMEARVSAGPIPDNAYDHARQGAWHEFIGDFRAVGRLDGVSSAYDTAVEVYLAADDPETGYSELEHMRLFDFIYELSRGTEIETEQIDSVRTGCGFTEWVEFKRKHLPELLSQHDSQVTWPVED